MCAFSSNSDLEPKVQFKFMAAGHKVGVFKAPATVCDEGTIVKMSSDGETVAVCGANDGTMILEQPVAATGAIGSAANREKYLMNVPQKAVAYGQEITVHTIAKGDIIWTKKLATGTETGAVIAASVTPGTTEFEFYNGIIRIKQGSNVAKGVFLNDPDDDGGIDCLFY